MSCPVSSHLSPSSHLPPLLSHPPVLFISFLSGLTSFSFHNSREEARQKECETSREVCERRNTLQAICIKPSVVLLCSAIPSTVCLLHPLSSYQSVYSNLHYFFSPRFQRENQSVSCTAFTWGQWEQFKMKRHLWRVGRGDMPVSGRIGWLSCQWEVVARW